MKPDGIVGTNLLGRWVTGKWVYENADYVYPERGLLDGYSRKEEKTLTKHQMTHYYQKRVTEKIVAVTTESTGQFQTLRFWVLIDGKPEFLQDGATVMPIEWSPAERL